jgi:hypothetical protein
VVRIAFDFGKFLHEIIYWGIKKGFRMNRMIGLKFIFLAAVFSGLINSTCIAWEMKDCPIPTEWGKQVTPENVWQEYPRPAMKRSNWTNLNGLWNYAIAGKDDGKPTNWDGEILVPFAVESALSGVKKSITKNDAIWYSRTIKVKKNNKKTYLLNFEAVDYQSTVWVNGTEVGENTGGNLPFSFDMTKALKSGNNNITLKVYDATNAHGVYQLHGKQVMKPTGIWYTPVSGIWQTVWMEELPKKYIKSLKITPKITGDVTVEVDAAGSEEISLTASLNGKKVAQTKTRNGIINFKIKSPKLWSPETPTLYDLEIIYGQDTVTSYVGLRETTIASDSNGNLRFMLNGKPYFHWGTLDQGWWPDGLLTPPSDQAMLFDIKFLKAAGFNTIRKHIKVEPRRYYTYCDRIGMLMWQDQVSNAHSGDSPRWTRLQPNPEKRVWPQRAHQQYMKELKQMIDGLYSHPCIVQWVPFNEAWGQHQTVEVGQWTMDYDPTRQINIASGGNWYPIGHIVDQHHYPHPSFPFELGKDGRFDGFVKVVGEFGGHGFPVKDHLWDPSKGNWGYGELPKDKQEWKQRYATSIHNMCVLKMQGIAGAIYTQTTDVEGEINGLLTYDRKEKVGHQWLKVLSDMLLNTPGTGKVEIMLPTAREEIRTWNYTLDQPAADWAKPQFDDSAWQKGKAGFGTVGTPNVPVKTKWDTSSIWIRHSFQLNEVPKGLTILKIYHDEDADVYLNGQKIAELKGYTTGYISLFMDAKARTAFKVGTNVIAIHCKQTIGGQFIDAGFSGVIPE